MGHRTVSFDGMCWPLPNEDVENKLRYVTIDKLQQVPLVLDNNDLLIAAQIMAAYRAMISKTRDQRQKIVSEIRKEMNRKYRWERE